MTTENGIKDRAIAASSQQRTNRQWLTFKEFVRRQEENKQPGNLFYITSPDENYLPDAEPPAQQELFIAPEVPLIDLADLLLAGAMLFIFVTMLLLFVY